MKKNTAAALAIVGGIATIGTITTVYSVNKYNEFVALHEKTEEETEKRKAEIEKEHEEFLEEQEQREADAQRMLDNLYDTPEDAAAAALANLQVRTMGYNFQYDYTLEYSEDFTKMVNGADVYNEVDDVNVYLLNEDPVDGNLFDKMIDYATNNTREFEVELLNDLVTDELLKTAEEIAYKTGEHTIIYVVNESYAYATPSDADVLYTAIATAPTEANGYISESAIDYNAFAAYTTDVSSNDLS